MVVLLRLPVARFLAHATTGYFQNCQNFFFRIDGFLTELVLLFGFDLPVKSLIDVGCCRVPDLTSLIAFEMY
jgi:hypothetical protein